MSDRDVLLTIPRTPSSIALPHGRKPVLFPLPVMPFPQMCTWLALSHPSHICAGVSFSESSSLPPYLSCPIPLPYFTFLLTAYHQLTYVVI